MKKKVCCNQMLGLAAIALTTLVGLPGFAKAQAPAGPLPGGPPQPTPPGAQVEAQKPQVKPRTSILGEWKLNRDESDDPRKKMQDARSSGGGRRGGVRMGGPGIGMGGGLTVGGAAWAATRAIKTGRRCRKL